MSPRTALVLVAMAGLPRLLLFPLAENVAGDAVARTWLAHAWLEHPHLIGASSHGVLQFGPLHIVLVAIVEDLTGSIETAGKWLSLLVGTLSVLPVFAITRRLFSERAGFWSAGVFALWPLGLQASTTAASEALSCLFILLCVAALVRAFDTSERQSLLLAALSLTLASAVRYDAWPWVGLLSLVVWWQARSFARAVLFGAVAASFPIAWLAGHLVDTGDALAPIRLIDDYHRAWFVSESALWGPTTFRFIVLGFWPLTALITLTPPLSIVGGVAAIRAWRGRARWLVLLILVSTAVMSLRGALLGSFVPLSRFTMKELSLFTIFIGAGLAELAPLRPWARYLLGLFVLWLPGLELAARSNWRWAHSFRAVSPLSLNALELRDCLAVFRERVSPSDVVAIDVDPRGFDDLQFAFETRLPQSQVARKRAPSFDERVRRSPDWLLLFDGGVLTESSFAGVTWIEAARSGNLRLLHRAP
jgi:hypothetical protein